MKIVTVKKEMELEALRALSNRSEGDFKEIDETIEQIINKISEEGDSGLYYYLEEYDGVTRELLGESLRVSQEEIEKAYFAAESEILHALHTAAENIRSFHEKQKESTWTYEKEKGVTLGQLITPLDSAGVYIPGGKAAYPSTVLMNVIPAKLAGVPRVVMMTPPQKDGSVNPYILAAAKIAGADEIYKVGGAQAIAALAYGTESIKPVCKITGPGNIFVARAKKRVFGLVDIDMIAGPSEIAIIADENANPYYIAADMLSQAEHDEMAASILITTSEILAEKVFVEVERQLGLLDREAIAKESIKANSVLFVTEDLDSAFDLSNEIAPEHLELMIDDPKKYMNKVRNAGAVFLGSYSPEPLGDYLAGPNHTLPTSGTAKFASPLGVYDFQKKTSIIYYEKEPLKEVSNHIVNIAAKEGLTAHGNAIKIRFEK